MHRQLRRIAGLALLTLLVAAPGLALAHGEGPQQTVEGYIVTLLLPEEGLFTGRNPVAVSVWDWRGNAPEASVSIAPLAFTPPADGHGHDAATDDHADEAGADAHGHDAATDDHADEAGADAHGHDAATDDHADEADAHDHSAASATEGRGLAVSPVALTAGDELGEHRGELAFDEAGTYTIHVVFTIDGQEHGALFEVAVAQSRPRGLVLGGFALVNALAIGVAAFLKWRAPAKPARAASAAAPNAEEQPS